MSIPKTHPSRMRRIAGPLITVVCGIVASTLMAHIADDGGPAWPFVKLLLVLGIMVLLLREGVTVGFALLAGALTLGAAFGVPLNRMGHAYTFGIFSASDEGLRALGMAAIRVSLMVYLINFLGDMLVNGGGVQTLVESLERIFRDARWVMATIPATMGLLPMPGGAMLSAPMVGGLGDRLGISPAQKTLANLWFRHIWEWWWPIFPAILILLQDGYVTMRQILAYQGPFTIVAIATGWFFLLRRITCPRMTADKASHLHDLARILSVIWPVLVVVGAALISNFPATLADRALPSSLTFVNTALVFWAQYEAWTLPVALIIVNVAFVLATRFGKAGILRALRSAGQWQMFSLIVGVYVLRGVFELAGASQQLPVSLDAFHVPAMAACFIVPFVISLITGYNLAGVSMAFPLLVVLFVKTGPAGVAVAYSGAMLGVLASPVHLCLILTREYFHAEWGRVYRLLIPMLLVLLLAAVCIAWIG